MSEPYRPAKQSQMDGTYYASANCVPASAVMAADRHTTGRLRTTPSKIRRASGDTSGGLTYAQAAEAVEKVTGQILAPKWCANRGEYRDLIKSGRGAVTSIDTSVTRYTSRRTNYFVGAHSVYVNDYEWVPKGGCRCELAGTSAGAIEHGEFSVEDPGTTAAGYLWWSAGLLYRAAEKRTGGNGINTLHTRDTEDVWRTARETGVVRLKPTKLSARVAPIKVDTKYWVAFTTTGATWTRANGTLGNGWHRVTLPVAGYIRGEALR